MTDGERPCQECGSPVVLEQIPTPGYGSAFQKSIAKRVCTNPGCKTHMPGYRAP